MRETKKRVVRRLSQIRKDDRRPAITGRIQDDGSVTMAGAPTGKSWVRSALTSRDETAVWGIRTGPNVPVIVDKYPNGDEYIEGADIPRGTVVLGALAESLASPWQADDARPTNVQSQGFLPGRVTPSESGSTYLHVEAFDLNGELVASAEIDVTAYYPVAADTYGRIGVYYNSALSSFVAFSGEASTDLATVVNASDDRDLVPVGMIPNGAVIVSTDSSGNPNPITANSYFESWRNFLSPNGSLLTGLAVSRTISAGELTTGSEAVVVIAAETGSTDDLNTFTTTGLSRDILLTAASGHVITLKDSVDNLVCARNRDLDLDDTMVIRAWYDADNSILWVGGVGGAEAFTDLTDAPASYSGAGDQAVFVNALENALEFRDALPVASKTRLVGTVLWDKTLGSAGDFDTDDADDFGSSGALDLTSYDYVEIIARVRGAAAATGVNTRIALNNDTTPTNYQLVYNYKGSADGQGLSNNSNNIIDVVADNGDANYFAQIQMIIIDPGESFYKTVMARADDARSPTAHNQFYGHTLWRNTAAITRITYDVNNATTTFVTGSRLQVIGYKRETIGGTAYAEAAISATPTDAELDGIFGTPASLPIPFNAIVKDSGDASNQWVVWSDGTQWLGVQGTVLT